MKTSHASTRPVDRAIPASEPPMHRKETSSPREPRGWVCAAAAVLVTGVAALPAQEYTVVDLSAALPRDQSGPVYPTSSAASINERGVVLVSGARTSGVTDAILWDNGNATVLPVSGVIPTALDAAGRAGGVRPGTSKGWYAGSGITLCVPDPTWCNSPLYFYATSRLLGMEEGGRFTGDISVAGTGGGAPYGPEVEAYVAQLVNGQLQIVRLGLLNGQSTVGWGINPAGDVVGTAGAATSAQPVLIRQGQAYPLPILRLAANRAAAINQADTAVGYVSEVVPVPGFNACQGAVWDVSTPAAPALVTIGQWQGSNRTLLQDVNDAAVAVGVAIQNEVSIERWRRAIRWDAKNGIVALDTLLGPGSQWQLSDAVAINDAGQIAATGRLNGSLPRAVRLDPIRAGFQDTHHRAPRARAKRTP